MKNNKLIIILIVFITAISIVLSGCSIFSVETNNTPPESSPSTSETPPQGITVNNIKFEQVNEDDMTDAMKNDIILMKYEKGYYYWIDDKGVFTLFISMGEKQTAGYAIEVVSIEDNEGKTYVLVTETSPKTDDMVAQVLTYPYTIVRMQGVTDRFTVTNNGKDGEYKQLQPQYGN